MKHNGQITVFVIIGLVILLVTGLFIYISTRQSPAAPNIPTVDELQAAESEIQSIITGCVQKDAPGLIAQLALNGGKASQEGVLFNNSRFTVYCTNKATGYCMNKAPLKKEMEQLLADQIRTKLSACVDFASLKRKFELSEGTPTVKVVMAPNNVNVFVEYPIMIKRGDNEKSMKDFSATITLPLGRMYSLAVDITNKEIEGFFDKDEWMVGHGMEIIIYRHKPYPDTVYILKKRLEFGGREFDFQFNFAIEGKETFNKEVLKKGAIGKCLVTEDQYCYLNREGAQDCKTCPEITTPVLEGCCVTKGDCSFTKSADCTGQFILGDMLCQNAPCPNLHCQKTESFQNAAHRHGESWCVYDSLVGRGNEYVGSRQYLHTCINGEEIIDECRDYREELCTDELVPHSGEAYSKGVCRTNRWYDCYQQTSPEACNDKTKRDCYWFGALYSSKKCHPMSDPGFRFWLGENAAVCSQANENSIGMPFPLTFGHSALLYCNKIGDCGYSRNIADVLTKGGWYHPYDTNRVQSWVYWPAGMNKKGTDYVVTAGLDNLDYNQNMALPSTVSGGKIRCMPWRAPPQGDCSSCFAPGRACSEYRCKSLGQNCKFSYEDGVPKCSGDATQISPDITVSPSGVAGYDYISQEDGFCAGETTYRIAPDIPEYAPTTFRVTTNEDTKCVASVVPPCIGMSPDVIATSPLMGLPDIVLSDGAYTKSHSITLRLPSVESANFTGLGYYPLYVQCENKFGYMPAKLFSYSMNVLPAPKQGADVVSANLPGKGAPGTLIAYVNRPFNECAWATEQTTYDQMEKLDCKADKLDVNFVLEPLGTYPCISSLTIPETASKFYMQCADKNMSLGSMTSYPI